MSLSKKAFKLGATEFGISRVKGKRLYALEQECGSLLQYLTNKSKIVFLTTTDTINGKMIQKQSEPVIQHVENEDNEAGEVVVGEAPDNSSMEAEPVAEEGEAEEDQERLDLQGLDC